MTESTTEAGMACSLNAAIVIECWIRNLEPDVMPPAAEPDAEPAWLRWLSRLVLRQGMRRSVALLTLLVGALAVLISQAVIGVLGHGDRTIAALSASLCSLVLTPLLGAPVLRLVFSLEAVRRKLNALVIQDDLTGVYNRRHFMSLVQGEWGRARRYHTPAALLLIDADHFKRVNDSHGHLCGDELLRAIAGAVGGSLRQADVLARFGGEEFIVFLPHTDPLGALDVAERIRTQVQAINVEWRGQSVATTVSIGVAQFRPDLLSLDWTIHEADTALYAAKAAGRNCVRALPMTAGRNGDRFETSSTS
jgi:diguanylate cyclase (GGDEF)-like protein